MEFACILWDRDGLRGFEECQANQDPDTAMQGAALENHMIAILMIGFAAVAILVFFFIKKGGKGDKAGRDAQVGQSMASGPTRGRAPGDN